MKVCVNKTSYSNTRSKTSINETTSTPIRTSSIDKSIYYNSCVVRGSYFNPSFMGIPKDKKLVQAIMKKASLIKNNDNSPVFSREHSFELFHSLTDDNTESVRLMLDSKDSLGGSLYDANNIINIAKHITNDCCKSWAEFLIPKKKTPDLILGAMELSTHPRFGQNIQFDPKILTKLTTAENKNGQERFGTYGIVLILDSINSSADAKKVHKLLEHQDLSAFEIREHIINNTHPKKQVEKYNDSYFESIGVDLSNVKDKDTLYHFLNTHKRHARKLVDVLKTENKNVEINLNAYDGKSFVNENLLSDIKRVADKKHFVHEFCEDTPQENVLNNLDIGEVAQVGKEMFVADKDPMYTNGKKRLYKMGLTKEKFLELFPPIERFNAGQGEIGDCWALSVLDGMMDKPSGRAKIFRSFSQEGEDLTAYLNINYNHGVRFKNGELLESESTVRGPKGIKTIEQAFAKSRNAGFWSNVEGNLTDKKEMNALDMGSADEAYNAFLKKGYFSSESMGNTTSINSQVQIANRIAQLANHQDYLLNCNFKPEFNNSNILANTKDKLFTQHLYAIKGYDSKKDEVYLSNPHETSTITAVPLEEFVKNVQTLSTCRMNKITGLYI